MLTRIILTLIGIKIVGHIAHLTSTNAANAAYAEAMRARLIGTRLLYGLDADGKPDRPSDHPCSTDPATP